MDIAADVASQTKLNVSKFRDKTAKGVNVVVGGVLNQLAIKKKIEPTEAQVKAKAAAAEAEEQRNYSAIRQGMLSRFSQLKQKVLSQREQFQQQSIQRESALREKHHQMLVQTEKMRAVRRARDKAIGETGENFGV